MEDIRAVELFENFVEEWDAGEDALGDGKF